MGKPLINLWSGEQPDIIGDDTEATLTLKNTSSGAVLNITAASTSSGTGITIDTSTGTGAGLDVLSDNSSWTARIRSALATAPALQVGHTVLSNVTVAPLNVVQSTASGVVLSIAGVFISTASINVAQSQAAFIIPVMILRALLVTVGAKIREFGGTLEQSIPSRVAKKLAKGVQTMYELTFNQVKDIVGTVWGHTELNRNGLALAYK